MTKKTTKTAASPAVSPAVIPLTNVPVKCRLHPKYGAIQTPRVTTKFPKGCSDCWEYFKAKQLVDETLPELYVRTSKAVGNRRSFDKPAEIAKVGLEYFGWCLDNRQVPTKTGMAVFMGVDSSTVRKYRSGEYDAKGDNPTHSAVIKRLDDVIIAGIEQRVLSGTGNQTGAIAWLNNMAGWSQNVRQQVEMGIKVELKDYSEGKPWSKSEAITASTDEAKAE